MIYDHIMFAGVELSSGRKPALFAALNQDLKILVLEKWSVAATISCLQEYPAFVLAICSPARKSAAVATGEFKKTISQADCRPFSSKALRRWMETDAQKSYLALCEQELLPRRALEGRIQRSLMLYEEGFQINDPMDFFEEITRHKIMQGILPLENLHTSRELDALMAAFVAWMSVQRASLVGVDGNFILPVRD